MSFKEVDKYLDKVDDVKKMLDGLMSKDEEQVGSSLPSSSRSLMRVFSHTKPLRR